MSDQRRAFEELDKMAAAQNTIENRHIAKPARVIAMSWFAEKMYNQKM